MDEVKWVVIKKELIKQFPDLIHSWRLEAAARAAGFATLKDMLSALPTSVVVSDQLGMTYLFEKLKDVENPPDVVPGGFVRAFALADK